MCNEGRWQNDIRFEGKNLNEDNGCLFTLPVRAKSSIGIDGYSCKLCKQLFSPSMTV